MKSPGQDRKWLVVGAAAACGFAAIFVTIILATRLPLTRQPLSAWWTMATAIVVGGLAATSLELFEQRRPVDVTGRLAGAIAVSGVASLAILVTTRLGGPLHLAFGCVLSLLFASTSIIWGMRDRFVDASETAVDGSDQGCALPGNIAQALKRYVADGRDHLEASVRVRFQPGQQTAIIHLPIQPPMPREPEVECEPVDERDLRITVDPVQPYGVRLVCRRGAPWTEAAEAVIAVLVTADSVANAAA